MQINIQIQKNPIKIASDQNHWILNAFKNE